MNGEDGDDYLIVSAIIGIAAAALSGAAGAGTAKLIESA